MTTCGIGKAGYLKNDNPPMDLSTLPRCNAIAARTGMRCRRAALRGQDLCGIHAGRYKPGPRSYNRPSLSHGLYTEKAMQERKQARDTLHCLNDLIGAMNTKIQLHKPTNTTEV